VFPATIELSIVIVGFVNKESKTEIPPPAPEAEFPLTVLLLIASRRLTWPFE